MRRPPGLWILLSAGVVWLSLQDAYGLRATSLIFGKTTTTTTTTAKPAEEPEAAEEETATATDLSNDPNATKPTLTGNPQLDYIWDPNLPKELNGYNLSDYPFYERVPEDIDFKCDGLHDGFYASVAHKCQVYHHCLFGTRYDFLCANYTAFDQKTFICHFASEVDCANSKKFWHRNDALYKAATTTTIKPLVIYTTASPLSPDVPLTSAPLPSFNPGQRRPVGGRRRPFRRRRPQYEYYDEYYDEYYEERPRSNRGRKRPRPRPRPVYNDDYEEDYEEDRYQRRGVGSRREEERRPYDRRAGNRRKNKDRPKEDYEDEETDGDSEDEEYEDNRRKPNERRRPEVSEEDRYDGNRKRRPYNDRTEDYDKPVARKGHRQPPKDDYEDDSVQLDESKSFERPRKNSERRNKPRDDTRAIIKPVSGTLYDRPRVAPRIKLPVPKNEAGKYAYKPIGAQEASASLEEEKEYYDEYEEPVAVINNRRKPQSDARIRDRDSPKKTSSASRQRRPDRYDIEDGSRSKETRDKPKRPASEEYYDDFEEEEEEEKEVQKSSAIRNSENRAKVSTTTSTTTTVVPLEKIEQPVVRLVKRPFLPSRGGNPYAARGLQPVGNKAVPRTPEKVLEDAPEKNARVPINTQTIELQKPYQSQNTAGPRTTQKPKLPEHNPLDINEEDYDVTLNDALNPTLPNIPVRGSPVAFGPGSDYSFASSQRPRYTVDPVASPASSEYIYQAKPARQTYQPQRDQFIQSNAEFTGQYSNYRPRQAQQQTEVFYSRY